MCDFDQEQRRLIEQDKGRLFYFIHQHIHKLNQLLKCNICFEIYENPTTILDCCHIFCEQCIKIYLQHSDTENPPCPICRKPIFKNKLRLNNVLIQVIKFVTTASDQLKILSNCNDSLPFQIITTKLKENIKRETSRIVDKSFITKIKQSPEFNLLLNAKKILIGTDNNVTSIIDELPPVQSINFRDGSVKTPLSKKANKKLSKDPFDIVKECLIQNPLFKTNINSASKTYMKQAKNKDNIQHTTKAIPFEDDANRINVIKWLQNSQNKFEYKPQIEEKNINNESQSQSTFDMPSVSQRHSHRSNSPAHIPLVSHINKQKVVQDKIREKNKIIARVSRSTSKENYDLGRRTRSLEVGMKTTDIFAESKRHSIAVAEDLKENFVIEQFNSEEETLLNGMLKHPIKKADVIDLVEKECLNSIETELLQKNENKRKRKAKVNNKSDTSGWTRIKEFKKAIRKTERKPGKLTLTGLSRTSFASKNSNKSENSNKMEKDKGKKKTESKITEPVVILENINLTKKLELKTTEPTIIPENINLSSKGDSKIIDDGNATHVYDLNALESYISNNINKISHKGFPSGESPQTIKDVNKNKKQISLCSGKISENIETLSTSKFIKKVNKLILSDEKPSTSSDYRERTYLTRGALKNINESRKSTPRSRKKLFNDESKDNLDKITLNSENVETNSKQSAKQEISLLSETAKNNKTETVPEIKDNDDPKILNRNSDTDDELFIKPTQPINNEKNETTKKQDIFNDDDDEIFKVPTQVIINSHVDNIVINKSPNCLLKQKVQALSDIVNVFNIALDDQQNKSTFIAVLKDINQLILNEQESTIGVQVQTSNSKESSSFSSQNATTQTASPKQHKDVAVQTDICPSPGGFQISSTEMFKTQPVISTHMQTDDLACPKCSYIIKDSQEPITLNNMKNSGIFKKLTEKYALSESFDNINFETQDVIKGKQIQDSLSTLKNLKITQNDNFKSLNIVDNKENCLINQPNLLDTKKSLLKNDNKSYKRIRNYSSGSDLEEIAIKNVKKNKFVEDDDISIHFASELQEEIGQSSHKAIDVKKSILSGSSEDADYQECLNNILKSCDEKQFNNKKRIPKTPKQPPTKRSKTEDMIKECEMIIQEACSEAIRIENTENCSVNLNKENIPEPSKLTLTVLEEEFQCNFSGSFKKTVNIDDNRLTMKNKDDSEKSEGSKNKFSDSLFPSTDQLLQNIDIGSGSSSQKYNKDKDILPSLEEDLIEVFDEFNNPFENNTKDTIKENREKIKILQNITVCKNSTVKEATDLEEDLNIPEEMEETCFNLNNNDKASVKSEDMFLSDSDVVETTPEKNKPLPLEKLNLLSQAYFNPGPSAAVLPLPVGESPDVVSSLDPSPLSCLNEVFMPPPEFQDFSNNKLKTKPLSDVNNSEPDVILIENAKSQENIKKENPPPASSLTPDILLLPQNYESPKKKNPVMTSTPYKSQIISIKSLNISPIYEQDNVESNNIVNPIQAAQNSKFSPLTIVQNKAAPQRLSTTSSASKQKSILNYVRSNDNLNTINTKTDHYSQLSQKSIHESSINKKPSVACTRMNEEQLFAITSLANKKLITYSSVFSPTVTHMIVDVDKNNCVKDHTMKFVCAVASGIWVLSFGWVEECLKQGRILPEEPFEALDVSGIDGPKKSRLTRFNKQLLKSYKVHAAPPFLSTTQKEVENVIKLLGGETVPRPDELLLNDGKICLIITEAKGSEDFDLYEMWLQTLKVITVDLEWLSRSVGQYETLSLKPFTLCSEDNIGDLGYPEELLVELPFSYTQHDVNTM